MQLLVTLLMITASINAQEPSKDHEKKYQYSTTLMRYKELSLSSPHDKIFLRGTIEHRQISMFDLIEMIPSVSVFCDNNSVYGIAKDNKNLVQFNFTENRLSAPTKPLSASQAWQMLYNKPNPEATFNVKNLRNILCSYPTILLCLTRNSKLLGGYNMCTGTMAHFSFPKRFTTVNAWYQSIRKIAVDGRSLLLKDPLSHELFVQEADSKQKQTTLHPLPYDRIPLIDTPYDTDTNCTTIARIIPPTEKSQTRSPLPHTPCSRVALWINTTSTIQKKLTYLEHPNTLRDVAVSCDGRHLALITKEDRSAHLVLNNPGTLPYALARILLLPHAKPSFRTYYLSSPNNKDLPYLVEVTNQTVARYNFSQKTAHIIFEASIYDAKKNSYTKYGSILASIPSAQHQRLMLGYKELVGENIDNENDWAHSFISLPLDPSRPS